MAGGNGIIFTMNTNCLNKHKIFHHRFHVYSVCNRGTAGEETKFPVLGRHRRFSSLSVSFQNGNGGRPSSSAGLITWDDVFRASESTNNPNDDDLQGFFRKIELCNRDHEKLHQEFLPFVVEDHIVGYVHYEFAKYLRQFKDVFIFPKYETCCGSSKFRCHFTFHPMLRTAEDRTRAVGGVIQILGDQNVIPGIRNELYPVTSSSSRGTFFLVERAAAPFFGIKDYEVHMNGYVEKDGEIYLWIGKRSELKPNYPGMLDHLVAGGLPYGVSCKKHLVLECEEEAGIPSSISSKANPVGVVSYADVDELKFRRDVVFCYDLKLPEDFVPNNEGELFS
ncbi:OLC1v1037249C1 [Oldenlandia corymbosa var. corymbosa]|uniref:OLC1v1037249C1 n=1 Tax=Oldenlandia corymbosa var. corymbosa TaxID=529605 RepID=A0AAV1CXA7_OLDCO|nr:OLC1v1037249C1 [Oldenlandia corymbosa var. corymbosa]